MPRQMTTAGQPAVAGPRPRAGLAAVLVLLTGLANPAPWFQQARAGEAGEVLAMVEGEPITAEAFEIYFHTYLRQKLYHGGSGSQVETLRAKALNQLILERLIALEIEARAIAGEAEAVDRQITALRERYGQSERWAEIETRLPALRRELMAKSRLEVLKRQVEEVAPPQDAQLVQYYSDNLQLFTEPMAWDLSVILIGVHPSALSDEWRAAEARGIALHDRIGAGEDFATLAREISSHESAAAGGALGFVHKGQLAPDVETALETLTLGQITEPIRVLEGYALFQKKAERPAETYPYETVKTRVRDLYIRTQEQTNWQRFTEGLTRTAQVTVIKQGGMPEQKGTNPPN